MDNMSALVSIIIPIYKVEEFLKDCLDSVINQTYKNLEILLIDDGSPDKCPAMCDEYAKIDSRIKVFHKENGGLSDARNFGITKATGDFLCFIDSDDLVHKNYVFTLVYLQTKYDADIVECGYLRFKNDLSHHKSNNAKIGIYTGKDALKTIYSKNGCQVVSWNKLYKSMLFTEVLFPMGKLHEDVFTTYKLLYLAKKIVITNDVLYFYRDRPNSISNDFNIKRLDIFIAFEEINQFYSDNNLESLIALNLQRALNVCIRFYSETNDPEIRKILRNYFEKFYSKYKIMRNKSNILLLIHYNCFYLSPWIDNFIIGFVDKCRFLNRIFI